MAGKAGAAKQAVENVVSFGQKASEIRTMRASRAMDLDLTKAIPGAEEYARFIEPEVLRESTVPWEDGLVGTADAEVWKNVLRNMGGFNDDNQAWITEQVQTLLDQGTFDKLPTFTARYNPRTLNVQMYLDEDELALVETLRLAGLVDERTGQIPFNLEWEQAPWEFSEDFRHSGIVELYDTDQNLIQRLRMDEMDFPFDPDFQARRDPEMYSSWWSNNPVRAWAVRGDSTAKNQASSPREAEELVSMMFSEDAADWFSILNHYPEPLGRSILGYHDANGINMPDFARDSLMQGDARAIEDALLGRWEPRIDWKEAVLFEAHVEVQDVASGMRAFRDRKNSMAARDIADVPAPEWAVAQYFDTVFDTMKEKDPGRYKKMLDFVKDSPYRAGNVHNDVANKDAPLLLFHSGRRHIDPKKVEGNETAEAPQFLTPGEGGMHMGELPQSANFGNFSVSMDNLGNISSRSDSHLSEVYDKTKKRYKRFVVDAAKPELKSKISSAIAQSMNELGDALVAHPEYEGMHAAPDVWKAALNKLIPGWGDEADTLWMQGGEMSDEMSAKIVDQILKTRETAETTPTDRARAFTVNFISVMSDAKLLNGQYTYPLVFKGKRPFRIRDVSSNTPQHWAVEMLKYPGFQRNSDWSSRLEAVSRAPTKDKEWATREMRSVLNEAGFDHILYVNTAENPGRPSIMFWDQSLAKPLYGSEGFDSNSSSWVKGMMAAPGTSIFMEDESE